jgi:ribosomal protein S14
LDRRAKVELFEQIRREYDHGVGTIKGVSRKLGIHRRMVREALGDAVPRERKINMQGKPRIEPVKPSSKPFCRATRTRRESNDTQRTGSGRGYGRSFRKSESPRARFVVMFASGKLN